MSMSLYMLTVDAFRGWLANRPTRRILPYDAHGLNAGVRVILKSRVAWSWPEPLRATGNIWACRLLLANRENLRAM